MSDDELYVMKHTPIRVAEAWKDFYHNKRDALQRSVRRKAPLSEYQLFMLSELSDAISRVLKTSLSVAKVWSAGSGIDKMAVFLKKRYKESIEITVQDVSEECISLNRRMFSLNGVEAEFICRDIFDSRFEDEFDVAYNTGVFEYFPRIDQERILDRISAGLKNRGVFLTATPFQGGRIYRHCRDKAMKKGAWPEGPMEYPIVTLRNLKVAGMTLEAEFPIAGIDQLYSIRFAYPILSPIVEPTIFLSRLLRRAAEPAMINLFSGYCLFDRFRREVDCDKSITPRF